MKLSTGSIEAVVQRVFAGQIPLAVHGTPAITNLALGRTRLAGRGVDDQHLPVAVFDVLVARHTLGAQQPPHLIAVPIALQLHKERKIGVTLHVIDEIRHLAIDVVFLEDDVIDRHPQRRVLARLNRNPLVTVFADLAEVRRENHELGPLGPRFRDEMHVGGTRHVQVRRHRDDELAVVPVRAFAHVGLIAPDFRERGRQIGVPVVEAHIHAAEELQEA